MKRNLNLISLLLCANFMVMLSGCGNSSQGGDASSKSTKKDYDIFIYNSDAGIASSFRKMCDEYTERTGIIIRTVTPAEDENNFENLQNCLSGQYPPDIFTVSTLPELKKLKDTSQIWDFSNATEEPFKKVANDIPELLRLSLNTTDSFGVPYTTEGYGFLIDPKMISSLFGGDKYRKVLADLQVCSYDEFETFVKAVYMYINAAGAYDVTLGGNKYFFTNQKGDLSKNLNGVFSFAAGSQKYCGTYLSNVALSSVFKSPAAANMSTDEDVENLRAPLIKFAQALDLITANIAGVGGTLGRGLDLISNAQNSVSSSMKNFVNGKSLFLLGSTEDYKNISVFDSSVAKRCVFIPIKMPFQEDEINSSEAILKNINRSIPIYSPRYYCMNAKSSEKSKKAAQDFLTWVKTSDMAQKYVISEFGFTPYDIKESSVIDNAFSRSMTEYISQGRVLPGAFRGAPLRWCNETLGKYLIEQFLTKANWDYRDYEKISNYAVEKWRELKISE